MSDSLLDSSTMDKRDFNMEKDVEQRAQLD